MRPTRVLAAFALAAGARAQGSLGGSQGSCTSAQAWAYRGCYGDVSNGNNAGFTFKLIGSASPSDPHYYPGYTTGQVSIDICLQGCRGHGFRFAALHGGTDCYCGTIKPTTQTLGSSTTNNNTLNECHVTSLLSGGCQGNKQEWCGSAVASDVYEDTSFPTVALTAQGGNYAYVGCFTVISPGDLVYATTAANTAACLSACANLGYPFAGMSDKGGVTNACQCGTEIQQGSLASTGQSCQPCGAGDNGASCGGLASGTPLLTVYRNTNLQGCYSPKVPSSSQSVTSTSQTVTSTSQTVTSTSQTVTSTSQTVTSTSQTVISSSVTSTAPVSTSTTSVVARDTTPRADGRCGLAFGGATCDPAGAYGGCCSSGGYCGTTDAHCLVSNGCQSGCTVTSSTAPRADGRCGSSFGGATCDPNGAYGGCCSSGGYCGSTPAHCLVVNGCQNGCALGVQTTTATPTPSTPTTTTTTTTSSSSSSSSTSSSTSSIVVGGSAPRADGRCGLSFGGATCDPNGAYGGCCSAGGYCGTTTAHCLVSNGCQSGCTAASSTAPRADGRCGVSYGGATCDPNGAYGGCCSSGGYCGSTDAHCLVVNGCQSGCSNVFQTTTAPTPSATTTTTPRLTATTTTTTTTTTSSSSTSSSSTSSALLGGAPPRTDGQCGSAFGGATCDPNGPYGGCCSQYGYCGSTPGHCLVANGCQNGCTDGLPVIIATTTTSTTPSPLPLPPTTTTTTTTTTPLPLTTTTTTTTPSASTITTTTTTTSSTSRSSTSSASSGGSAPPRADGQCGSAFGGATCDPNGAYGGCCSQYGYCGSSPGHCLVANGCQNGCTDGSPLVIPITTTTTGSSSSSSGLVIATTSSTTIITTSSTSRSSSTTFTASLGGSAPPRADGQCGSAFGGATCDPNGAYGGCCSQYGYCGSSPGHCLVANGCQNGCIDGSPIVISVTTTTSSSSSSFKPDITTTSTTTTTTSSTSSSTSRSSLTTFTASLGGSAPPRADGQCGSAFGGATCDPNGAYGGCCSQYGYCGSSPGHCLVVNGCQNGCTDGLPVITIPTSSTTSSVSSSSSSSITLVVTTVASSSTSSSTPPTTTTTTTTTTSSSILSLRPDITIITTTTTSSITRSSSTLSASGSSGSRDITTTTPTTSSSSLSTASTAPRLDGRCGFDYGGGDFGGATCDPNGPYGGCCSQYGYCGSSDGHCLKANGCQNGCLDGPDSPSPSPTSSTAVSTSGTLTGPSSSTSLHAISFTSISPSLTLTQSTSITSSNTSSSPTINPTTITTSYSTSSSSTSSTATVVASTAPRADGRCGYDYGGGDFGGATCDPSGPYGGCCSQYGYCGSSDGHCLKINGCQNGCSDGPDSPSPIPATPKALSTTSTSMILIFSSSRVTTSSTVMASTSSSPMGTSSSTSTGTTFSTSTGTSSATLMGIISSVSTSTTSLISTLAPSSASRNDGRCGADFSGATCDASGPYGGCCSQFGFCGATPGHCLVENGCQNGCSDPVTTTTSSTPTTVSGLSSATTLRSLGGSAATTTTDASGNTSMISGDIGPHSTHTITRTTTKDGTTFTYTQLGTATQTTSVNQTITATSIIVETMTVTQTATQNQTVTREPTTTWYPDGPTMPPSIIQNVDGYRYTGCYGELGRDPKNTLSDDFYIINGMTLEVCSEYCGEYEYFGLEGGTHCYCGGIINAGAEVIDEAWCDAPCTGNRTEICGGYQALDIYERLPGGLPISSSGTSSTSNPTSTVSEPTATSSCLDGDDYLSPAGYHYTQACNTYYQGEEYAQGYVGSVQECAQICDAWNQDTTHPRCLAALFDKIRQGNNCWVKTSRSNTYEWSEFDTFILSSGESSSSSTSTSSAASSTTASSTAASSIAASSTATSSTVTSSTVVSSATPTRTTSVCYDGSTNGSIITTPNNHQYERECATYYYGTEQRVEMTVLSLDLCAQQCDGYNYNPNEQNGSCVGVLFYPERDRGQCWLKFSIGASLPSADLGDGGPVDAALLVVKASSSTTTAASSTTSTASSTGTTACVNGSIFTVPDGRRFQTLCHLDWNSDGIYYTITDSLETCAAQCAEYNTGVVEQPCVGVSFVPGRQGVNCYLKYGFDRPVLDWPFEVDSALLLPEEASPTSALTPSATPSPTGSLTCADGSNNGTIYVTPSGHQYQRECGLYYYGSESDQGRSTSFNECAQSCDSWNSDPTHQEQKCVAILFFSKTAGSNCWLKFNLGGTIQNPNWGPVDSGLLLPGNSTSSSTTSSSTTSSSTASSSTTSSSYSSPTTFSTIRCPSAVTITEAAVTITKPAVTVTVTATISVNFGIP